jgi:hypothetical protein
MQRVDLRRGAVQDQQIVSTGGKAFALKAHTAYAVRHPAACGVEIKLTAIVIECCRVIESQPQITERLVCLGILLLHLSAELIGEVVVGLRQNSVANGLEVAPGLGIVSVARLPRPQPGIVSLQQFLCRIALGATTPDHRAQPSIANR